MFEIAELGNAVSQADYEAREPALRVDLINAQYDLRTADFPVVVQPAGADRNPALGIDSRGNRRIGIRSLAAGVEHQVLRRPAVAGGELRHADQRAPGEALHRPGAQA